jgi:tRNA(Ile)-lysidine synthase
MKVDVPQGKYVVAVSGGVDSMVLLDVLGQLEGVELVVAHFDHGIRADSGEDRKMVGEVAKRLGLRYVYAEGVLGSGASEDMARVARYAFLRKMCEATSAQAIITAHHQDDMLETAIWNMLRGTNRRGVTALRSTRQILRPLLHVSKQQIVDYAHEHAVGWHEDSTNLDTRYSRNYIRQHIVPALGVEGRETLLRLIERLRHTNDDIDQGLEGVLALCASGNRLDRSSFIQLPHTVSREVMAAWLRKNNLSGYDKKTLERLVIAAKTFRPGKLADIYDGHQMRVERAALALTVADR